MDERQHQRQQDKALHKGSDRGGAGPGGLGKFQEQCYVTELSLMMEVYCDVSIGV